MDDVESQKILVEFKGFPPVESESVVCPICQEGGQLIPVYPCRHLIHEKCLLEYIGSSGPNIQCPICRGTLYINLGAPEQPHNRDKCVAVMFVSTFFVVCVPLLIYSMSHG